MSRVIFSIAHMLHVWWLFIDNDRPKDQMWWSKCSLLTYLYNVIGKLAWTFKMNYVY